MIASMASIVAGKSSGYQAVPAVGFAGPEPLAFPLFLRESSDAWVPFVDGHGPCSQEQIDRLVEEGVDQLYIRVADRKAYMQRIEGGLDALLQNRGLELSRRAEVLYGVALTVAEDLLHGNIDACGLQRAQRLFVTASSLFLREPQTFSALPDFPGRCQGIVDHSVRCAFLTMGLAQQSQFVDPGLLVMAGLAGMLHDVGRVGYEDVAHDPEHAERGYQTLRRLNMAPELCEAVRLHHERRDGSGYPQALRGDQIPVLAQLVGMVDVFDKVHSSPWPKVSVFDALSIVAHAYRGCFDRALAAQFVRLFR